MKVSGAVAMADHVEAFGIEDAALVKFDADPFTPSEAALVNCAIFDRLCAVFDRLNARRPIRY